MQKKGIIPWAPKYPKYNTRQFGTASLYFFFQAFLQEMGFYQETVDIPKLRTTAVESDHGYSQPIFYHFQPVLLLPNLTALETNGSISLPQASQQHSRNLYLRMVKLQKTFLASIV
jgi:hypothetical protein